ncbi:MAG: MFS transporter [Sphingomonadales bacterium]|nr:MFS transporter [Sphingomonadales bacterium]
MSAPPSSGQGPAEPWAVLAPLGLAGFVFIGAMLASLSVYGAAMQARFGWTETELGGGPVALLLGMSLGNLGVGGALRRFDVRMTFVTGSLLAVLGWLAAAGVGSLAQFMLAMGIAGVGAGMATIVPGIAVLTRLFHRRRGLAVALFIGCCALASSTMPIVTGRLIEGIGWRGAFAVGGLAGLAPLPLILRVLPRRLPDADAAPGEQGAPGLARAGALRLPAFWLLVAVSTVSQVCMNGVQFTTVAFLTKAGLAAPHAVTLYSATNFMSLPGLLVGGYLSDRVRASRLLPAIIALQAMGTLALLGAGPGGAAAMAALALFVVVWGGVAGLPAQSAALLLAELIGQRSFGSLLGILFTLNGFLGAFGPGLTGWLHDLGGGYALPFGLFGGTLLVAAAAALLCRPAATTQPAR